MELTYGSNSIHILSDKNRSNYLVGSNLTNAFAIGTIGAIDDFFLIGAPATEVHGYPYLTGNFLDGEGNHLFTLVRNILTVNPRHCSKIIGDHIGFEIHDGEGRRILKTESRYNDEKEELLTTVEGTFFGKGGKQIAHTTESGTLQVTEGSKFATGFNGRMVEAYNMTQEEADIAAIVVGTGGTLHQVLTGEFENEDIRLDGKILFNTKISRCRILIERGEFMFLGNCDTQHNSIRFEGPAGQICALLEQLNQPFVRQSGKICETTGIYSSIGCHTAKMRIAAGETMPMCQECGKSVIWELEK